MDKPKKTKKKPSTKFFEFSSRETTPNPFSDDGEYGSDVDYDPDVEKEEGDSSSNVSNSQSNTHSERSDSNEDSNDSECSSSESIFDSHKRELSSNKESKSKICKLQTKQELGTSKESKKINSKPENDKDSDTNSLVSLSINSEVLRRNIDALNMRDSLLLNDLTDIELQSQLLSDNHTNEDQAFGAQSSLALPECSVESNMTSVIQSFLSSPSKPTSLEGNSTVYLQSHSPLSNPKSHAHLPPLDSANTKGHLTPSAQKHTASPDSIPCPSLDPANTEGYLTPIAQQHTSSPDPDPSLDSINTEGNFPPPSTQQYVPSTDPITCAKTSLPLSQSPQNPPLHPQSRTSTPVNEEANLENENDTAEGHHRHFSPEPTHDWENTTADIPNFEFDETSTRAQFEITNL